MFSGTPFAANPLSGWTYLPAMLVFGLPVAPAVRLPAWLPFTVPGAKLALRDSRWRTRLRWWALSAVALSQIIAVWPGQGAY